jgi:hypothetical protein
MWFPLTFLRAARLAGAPERGVWTAVIVGVEPRSQRSDPSLVGPVEPDVGPFVDHRAVETLYLPVGLTPLGPGGRGYIYADVRSPIASNCAPDR